MTLAAVSIIIPLGPDEDQLAPLLADLAALAPEAEVILVSCTNPVACAPHIRQIIAKQGRASQQNAGAEAASRDFLWFLHADSRLSQRGVDALAEALKIAPAALHYFHLKFRDDGPRGMGLNEWGARFRSEILGVPFGDQGFCLSVENFNHIGRFPEDVAYGEDHLLVWHARQAGVKLRCVGAALETSARKYSAHGWGALTLKYQYYWVRQALPELWQLIRNR
ncbi:MAG TPA: glycosyl transferase family 2 [Sphingomonadales bacterium]|nr:glycosyl transferase family 2 [Sphingomonadales bacterium]